ncbi:MAG: aminopeptidase P family protein [Desulfobacteraceae bacterium]|nr:MAG: aminopeptidase P family protein [Desulfobacteraceae bacterium]
MKKNIYRERLRSLRKKMKAQGLDTVWIIQPENRRYLSGFKAADFDLTESSGSLLINDRQAYLLTDSRYTIEAEKEAEHFKVLTFKRSPFDLFPEVLAKLKTKTLGFEQEFITLALFRQLQKKVQACSPPVRLTALKRLPEQMREVKDWEEIKQMTRASEIMSHILAKAIKKLKPGCTEMELARDIEAWALKAGADELAFPSIIASGPNSALPHATPSGRKIRAGEPIVFDVGVKWNGYCCDMTRTVFIGEPRPKFKKIYNVVRRAQLAGLAALRAGAKNSEPDKQARRIIQAAGFGDFFGHGLGHGVGLATHELPYLSSRDKPSVLGQGMVVTVEPGIYIPGEGGVRLEDMVVITKQGCEILTRDRHYYDFS